MSARIAALLALVLCLAQSAWAQDDPADATPFKLTVGAYQVSGGGLPSGPGLDTNLRYSYGEGNVWLGWFRSPTLDFNQLRTGWDRTIPFGPVRLLPSLQAASGGFVGGSLAIETGDSWLVGAGLGRTNLRNYANLNFDPNDSVTVYGGYRWDDGTALSLVLVRDNRQNPDQQDVHLVYKRPLPDRQRLTIDLLAKQGTVDGQFIRRTGLTVTYDWARWFVRAAYDPKVNFTAQDMVEVVGGQQVLRGAEKVFVSSDGCRLAGVVDVARRRPQREQTREYEFNLKFKLGPDELGDDEIHLRLGESRLHDALGGLGLSGCVGLEFIREAGSAEEAILSALADVRKALPKATLVEVGPDFVGLRDVADMVGVSRQNMRKLFVSRPSAFPPPVHGGSAMVWHLAQILLFLRERKYDSAQSMFDVARTSTQVSISEEKTFLDSRLGEKVRQQLSA